MLVVRPARPEDLDDFHRFAKLSGAGFTSLPDDRAMLEARLKKSIKSFKGEIPENESGDYLLMVERANTNEVFGCCAVKTNIGCDVPFFNFRVTTLGQLSRAANKRFDISTLVMVNDYTGATEVGTLFLDPQHRGEGAGKLLSLSRFMLMAANPNRFHDTVVSELRGIVHLDGRSPFWEGVGRPFFRMDFAEADNFSALTDNQFIIDLGPKHPIYIDLLPDSARGAIAETHPDGAPARRLLEREGLRFEGVIDIFDGGPLLAARLENTRTFRESVRKPFKIGDTRGLEKCLISNDKLVDFRCTLASCDITADHILVAPDVLETLELQEGEWGRAKAFDL
ncbi:arginine N-succinyltransferase [Pseudaquidulcibacter saccharophilus]|uniref:arginine N-succinyltransferase n=1 Tax=Pseudaquidulcibacter saccharophilus TaxID=2831900 RepID=UPI001EFF0232|nr:arginine N-succinyltransferase [Pseudaquidulcibacter saccharophilus]